MGGAEATDRLSPPVGVGTYQMRCPACRIGELTTVEDISRFGPAPVPPAVLQRHPLPWQYCVHCGGVFTNDLTCRKIGRMNDQDNAWEWSVPLAGGPSPPAS